MGFKSTLRVSAPSANKAKNPGIASTQYLCEAKSGSENRVWRLGLEIWPDGASVLPLGGSVLGAWTFAEGSCMLQKGIVHTPAICLCFS